MPVLTLDYRHCDRKRPKFIKHVEIEAIAAQARQQLVGVGVDAIAFDALRQIAYLTGQRIGDLLALKRSDVAGETLRITQGKTGERVAIAITGELADAVRAILARPRKVSGLWLICDDRGRRITAYQHWYAFRRTGATWHFHDLRAKAVSDVLEATGDIRQAQALAGHRSQKTTEDVYVRIRGRAVKPVK